MAIRKRTLRKMSPVARKLARFVNEFQSTTRRLKYLLWDIHGLELDLEAYRFAEKEKANVQPKDTGGFDSEDLSSNEGRQSRHDRVGKPGNRRGVAEGRKQRPRSKRKTFKKGERK